MFKSETQCSGASDEHTVRRQIVWLVNVTCYVDPAFRVRLTMKFDRICQDLLTVSKGLRYIGLGRGRAIVR
jgi:hypothetical protein